MTQDEKLVWAAVFGSVITKSDGDAVTAIKNADKAVLLLRKAADDEKNGRHLHRSPTLMKEEEFSEGIDITRMWSRGKS